MGVWVGFIVCLVVFSFLIIAGLFFRDEHEIKMEKWKNKYIYNKYLGRFKK
jgi:hypothetical protein